MRTTAAKSLFLLGLLATTAATHLDRRIVDRIAIGDAQSESDHAYAGEGVTAGISAGKSFRQARGWMRYALTVFDDTEVTVACTFLRSDAPRTFDVIVENHVVTSYTFTSADRSTVDFRVPLEITKGHTNILVVLRATNGSKTPALVELRSVQDHNE